MTYRLFQILLLGFLATYFLVGIYARVAKTEDEDIYPFFSWFLFTTVPARVQDDYMIKILEYNGQRLDPPVPVEKIPGAFSSARSLAEYFQITKDLGIAVRQGKSDQVSTLRSQLEKNILSSQNITYQVLEVRYNQLERFRTGRLLNSQEIATFKSGVY